LSFVFVESTASIPTQQELISTMSSSSDDDEDYAFGDTTLESKSYPVHDCCELEDAEALRVS